MYTKTDVLEIAKQQLALDYNCKVSDFNKKGNIIVENKLNNGRRIYDSDGCFFKAACFCGKVIISASPEIIPWCQERLIKSSSAWFFQYLNLRAIDKKLQEYGHEIVNAHHYYVPDPVVRDVKPITELRWYEQEEILQFKDDDRFQEAFIFDKNNPDMLGVAALDGDKIIGMAGTSADSKNLWQIGIDVLPEYSGRGIGTNLVTLLKNEVLKRGKVPFYGTVESHIYSQNIAIYAGFFPAWAEVNSSDVRQKHI
jgi:RimJ/RimL family protein N-acetyltransferase